MHVWWKYSNTPEDCNSCKQYYGKLTKVQFKNFDYLKLFSFKVQGAITLLKGCWFTELNTWHDDSGIFNVKLYYNVKFNCMCSKNIFFILFFHLLYMIYKLIKGFTIMLLSGLKKKLCWFAFFISTMTRVQTLLK